MVSVCLVRFLAGICLWVVGAGCAVSYAMDAAERFLLRSGSKVESSAFFFNVSIRCTLAPPSTMWCSFFSLFFLDPVVAAVISRLFCVEFDVVAVLGAVGVAIHGVEGSSSADDQMRYVIFQCICRRSTTS